MVMFVMAIAVMSIMMGVAVQTAAFQMQREREAELIFRGEQFIEAIRLYKIKYGRYPMQLKEIYEAKPRVIRKRWKDPITDSENWGIVFLGQEGQQLGQGGRQLAGPGAQDDVFGRKPVGTETPFGTPGRNRNQEGSADGKPGAQPGGQDAFGNDPSGQGAFGQVGADRKMGPIVGVHSLSCDEAIKIYEGHTTYCEWRFIFREQQQRGGRGGQRSPANPPVGWHPGDEIKPGAGGPGGGGTGPGNPPRPRSPGGSRPPLIQTPAVP
jgi:type II secretory pathway pseudopilin PulG